MSAMKDMVAGECGTSNALVRATRHMTKDHAFQHKGLHRPGKVFETLLRSLLCYVKVPCI